MFRELLILLLSFLPSNGSETTVYIDGVYIENSDISIHYRINDSESKVVTKKYNSTESIVALPETTVRIGWSWEWVFEEYEWVVDCEPGTKVVWTY